MRRVSDRDVVRISEIFAGPPLGAAQRQLTSGLLMSLLAGIAASIWASAAHSFGNQWSDELMLGTLLVTAAEGGWPRDRVLWVGLGAFLALIAFGSTLVVLGSWKARWLRNLIGDEATAMVYLALAGIMVWVGLFTNWTFGRH